MARYTPPFFLVIVDDATETFSVEGPMQDDRPWNNAVVAAQGDGRRIRCFSVSDIDRTAVASRISREMGWTFSPQPLLATIAPNPATYTGPLPSYAARADRARVVNILCRGDCNGSRWAEMTIDYPGLEALRNMVGQLVFADCLKCGYRASDPYNWTRP